MNGPIEPEGDVLKTLSVWATPYPQADHDDVDLCVERIEEDLEEAEDAMRKGHDSSAMNNLEEAVLYFGYAAAYALGFKAKSSHVPHNHSKIIQFVMAYTEAYRPDLKKYSNRFQGIRVARNAIKYPESPGASISAKQMQLHFDAAREFWSKFRETPTQHLSQRLLAGEK